MSGRALEGRANPPLPPWLKTDTYFRKNVLLPLTPQFPSEHSTPHSVETYPQLNEGTQSTVRTVVQFSPLFSRVTVNPFSSPVLRVTAPCVGVNGAMLCTRAPG